MLIDDKVIECEVEYTKCFSEFYENENIIRFSDNQLKDMYCHNFTHIKKAMSDLQLKELIEDEISLKQTQGSYFCKITLDSVVSSSLLSTFKYKPEISVNGYYSFDISRFSSLNALSGCIVKKVDSEEMVDDLLFCDLQHDEKTLGKDFCTRRCYRRGKVYISDKGANSYLCYHKDHIMGNCDLFMYKGVAKIEDFGVIPTHQRKGYGTTILKSLIDTAIKEKSHTIYLVADEDDTAKDMYNKIGFYKIGERTELFFEL